MNNVLVFGHKSPDTDTITSSVVMANLEKMLGNDAIACRLGNLNKETKFVFDYLGMEEPKLIEKVEKGQNVILVDHNESKQSADGINEANILKVVDHHSIDFKTGYPLFYHAEPVGCTATILYKLYNQNNIEIEKNMAILMLSAIISDTLLFKSPTCTNQDKEVAQKLNEIAKLDIEKYGMEMLKAGTDLSDFSEEELIGLDAKEFEIANKNVVVAQINVVDINDVMLKKDKLEVAIKKVISEKNLGLFFFAITDIINSNSQVIAIGEMASIVEKAYNVKLNNNTALLEGVVSRKKQIIPVLTQSAQ
ncbi:manganese-dependent inorganic pyrophosphatase PpaC [Clostridium sp. CAG:921]|mgnify:FL=1|nr:manganese-dependent inorganic pyrophosphatase PpaC [Clostridium sp. CAG:921]